MLTRKPMASGQFEFDSLKQVRALGYSPEIIDSATIARRYPAWNSREYTGAVFNPIGGFLRSGRIIELFTQYARQQGVNIYPNQQVLRLLDKPLVGILLEDGSEHQAGHVIVATGAWSVKFLPDLSAILKSVGLPVFHVVPDNEQHFGSDMFPVFGADVSNTGWYGFPLNPDNRVIKIARHSTGRAIDPFNDPRKVNAMETQDFRQFLSESLPSLVDQPIVYTRLCLYSDTFDGDFIIDHYPDKPGVIVATGGSGHAFKFGSILGKLVSDLVDGSENKFLQRFRWRSQLSSVNDHADSSRLVDS